jgi:hypothetical protein
VEQVEIPLRLRDFQAQWESPAFGLFHGAAFSTALLPINCALDPKKKALGKVHLPPSIFLGELWGGVAGLMGGYFRSQRRVEKIRKRFP